MVREVCPVPNGGYALGSWQADRLHHWREGLAWASRAMLLLLLAHQIGLIICFGLKFFKKWVYCIDLIIVGVALGLEFAHLAEELDGDHHGDVAPEASNLIIVLLVWRVLRVVHGFGTSVLERAEEDNEIMEAEKKIKALELELEKYRKAGAGAGAIRCGDSGTDTNFSNNNNNNNNDNDNNKNSSSRSSNSNSKGSESGLAEGKDAILVHTVPAGNAACAV